jgi:hypothetical protein
MKEDSLTLINIFTGLEGHPEGSEGVRAAGDHVPAREGGGRDHGHLLQEGAHRRQGSGLHRLTK